MFSKEIGVRERSVLIYQKTPMLEKWIVFTYQNKPMLEKGMFLLSNIIDVRERNKLFCYQQKPML